MLPDDVQHHMQKLICIHRPALTAVHAAAAAE